MSRIIRVWDPLVRFGHWALVVLFIVAYVSEDDFLIVHSWAGYGIAAVVTIRIVWGFIGTPHARFSDFVYRPSAVFGYLRDLVSFRAKRYLGHSPAGGAMVVALLLSLAATTGTGMATFAVRYERGPLATFVVADPSQPPPDIAAAKAQRRIDRRGREIKEVHEFFVNLTLVLIGLHLAGVALASLVHRENLPQSMVTGDKRAE
ncbi:MAG TPA: cytochrome b/b6 domain-containing protein [Ferrovibrio sp.]|uniref:cytochrome b/b6 domain-containing protein n=1 Tax=Ferrovibrio sp. TaxID=1917215 RepID=UPI002ED5B1F0